MQVKVLASGSKGNVTYVCENDTRILIDIGMRCFYWTPSFSLTGLIDGLV